MRQTEWPGVFQEGRSLFTRNADPGRSVYGEELRTVDGTEYRAFNPWRSKLAALIQNAPGPAPIRVPRSVLYLGAAHGTTVSHLADMLPDVPIFAIERGPRTFAPLLDLARRRANLFPILADAQLPERYAADVGEVDLIYQDVAQRDQAGILAENARACLTGGGDAVLMVKRRSITQTKSGAAILAEVRQRLEAGGLRVSRSVDLAPFARDHTALLVRSAETASSVR